MEWKLFSQAGHRRWGIENQALNELTQAYHRTRCYHHVPTSILVQMLILIFAFTLFMAFALHNQLVRSGEVTRKKALANGIQNLRWVPKSLRASLLHRQDLSLQLALL